MQEKINAPDIHVQKRLLMSLLISMVLLLIGMAWTWYVWLQSTQYYHALFHAKEDLHYMTAMLSSGGVKK
jgi:hypothetical protein